ncbi:MAG: hypothetical protein ACOX6T_15685 [Myxococcales bacterium]|jgi:hypothetical protein
MAAKKTTAKKTTAKKTTAKKATAKKATAKKPAAKKAGAKKAAGAKAERPEQPELKGAARRAAEFLGMDPTEVAVTAEKIREQSRIARKRIVDEMERLGKNTDKVTARLDAGIKDGMKKVERVADEMAKGLGIEPEEFAKKVEVGFDRASKEAVRMAEEASVEMKKMYEQARVRLKDILEKQRKKP